MKGLTLTNDTGRNLTLIVEPVADEYAFNAGDTLELGPPFFLDRDQVIHVEISSDYVVLYAAEEISIKRDGEPVPRVGA